MSKRTDEIMQAAIEGFEAQKKRLNEQIAELRGMLSGASSESVSASPANGRTDDERGLPQTDRECDAQEMGGREEGRCANGGRSRAKKGETPS